MRVPEPLRQEFFEKQITVGMLPHYSVSMAMFISPLGTVEYENLSPAMERDIFQRVQLGMPLTAAGRYHNIFVFHIKCLDTIHRTSQTTEKLQAVSSVWATWISGLDSRYMSCENGITDLIDVDIKRGRNFQSLAHLVYCCHGIPEQLTPSPVKLEKFLTQSEDPSMQFSNAITQVVNELMSIAKDKKKARVFKEIKQRVAPIEFVFIGTCLGFPPPNDIHVRELIRVVCLIGVTLYVMMNYSNTKERAEELYNMRTYIRRKYQDVRARSDIIRDLWIFVADIARKYRTGYHFEKASTTTRGAKKRRARADEDSDEDMDTGRAPKSRKGRR